MRFVWGIESDDRLNRHPEPPPEIGALEWSGRFFDRDLPIFVRTERQLVWGLPEVDAFLFLIRVGHVREVDLLAHPEWTLLLREALNAMTPDQLTYKGLSDGCRDAVIDRLDGLASKIL